MQAENPFIGKNAHFNKPYRGFKNSHGSIKRRYLWQYLKQTVDVGFRASTQPTELLKLRRGFIPKLEYYTSPSAFKYFISVTNSSYNFTASNLLIKSFIFE